MSDALLQVVRGRRELAPLRAKFPGGLALAIGNFDGVHRGHQALVHAAQARGAARGATTAVLTFDPHPAQLFAPTLAPPLIVSLGRRLELLAAAGARLIVVEPFDAAFAAIEAADFVSQVLRRDLDAREVVVGYDFSFGRERAGDARLLAELGASLKMGVTVVPRVSVGGLTCSSTKVREFVLEGRVDGAALLLGRPFEISGAVVHGAGRGKALGVPTANVEPEGELLPGIGIYAGRATVLAGGAAAGLSRPCAISVGTNPQFSAAGTVGVEAHLLDYDGDLYGQRLRIDVMQRLRGEQRFASIDALLAQISDDVAQTRKIVS
ncbi:MAG TPA: bifunctional riboflavin kinase/FAD synthetase [Polyangia bacterium]|nr:bifunctional riboflavin kinase/FAD synthetase [Polyangia bacterium]